MAQSDEPRGIGGWLIVFLVLVGVLSPTASIIRTLSEVYVAGFGFGDISRPLMIIDIAHFAASLALHWYIVWRLLAYRVRRTVPIVIAGLWMLSVGLVLLKIVAEAMILGRNTLPTYPAAWLANIPPVIWSMIWTAYFLRSRRVANTYPRDAVDTDLPQVFE